MGEKVQVAAKKPEVKRENQASKSRNADQSQSMSSSVDQVLYLQRTIGNQAVQKLARSGALQAKLRIGQPRDKYEQEADRVADAVMRMPEPQLQRQPVEEEEEEEEVVQTELLSDEITPLIQRQEETDIEEGEEELVQTKTITEQTTTLIQRQVEEEDEEELGGNATLGIQRMVEPKPEEESIIQSKRLSGFGIQHVNVKSTEELKTSHGEGPAIQTKDEGASAPRSSSNFQRTIQLSNGGLPLSDTVRSSIEPVLGADLGNVRVHSDANSNDAAKLLQAKAFTHGTHIWLGPDQSADDIGLMAHEATHVVQQGGGPSTQVIQRADNGSGTLEGVTTFGEGIGGAIERGREFVGGVAERIAEVPGATTSFILAQLPEGLVSFIRRGPLEVIRERIGSTLARVFTSLSERVDLGDVFGRAQAWFIGTFARFQRTAPGDGGSCSAFATYMNNLYELARDFLQNPIFEALRSGVSRVNELIAETVRFFVQPAVDAIPQIWSGLQNLGATLRVGLSHARTLGGRVWTWVARRLGLSTDDSGDILTWLRNEANQVWTGFLQSAPRVYHNFMELGRRFYRFSPLHLLHEVVESGRSFMTMARWIWAHRNDPNMVASATQDPAVRDTILPRFLEVAHDFGGSMERGFRWLNGQLTSIVASILNLLSDLSGVPILNMAVRFVGRLRSAVERFRIWTTTSLPQYMAKARRTIARTWERVRPIASIVTMLGIGALNPPLLPGIILYMLALGAWLLIPNCYKEPIIDFVLRIITEFLRGIPDFPTFGPLWHVLKPGIIAFLERVRERDPNKKIEATDRIARILLFSGPEFVIGFVVGVLQGIWEALTDPFKLLFQLAVAPFRFSVWVSDIAGRLFGRRRRRPSQQPVAGTGEPSRSSAGLSGGRTERQRGSTQAAPGTETDQSLEQIGVRLNRLGQDLREPAETIRDNLYSALREYFSGSEGSTFETLRERLGQLWERGQDYIQAQGRQLADRTIDALLAPGAERVGSRAVFRVGKFIGWLGGTIVAEVVIAYLSAGTVTFAKGIMKVIQKIARVVDYASDIIFGPIFRLLRLLGRQLMRLLRPLGRQLMRLADNIVPSAVSAGRLAIRSVLDALTRIGTRILRFSEEVGVALGGRVTRGVGEEVAESIAGRAAGEALETTTRETTERGAQETVEALAGRRGRVEEPAAALPGERLRQPPGTTRPAEPEPLPSERPPRANRDNPTDLDAEPATPGSARESSTRETGLRDSPELSQQQLADELAEIQAHPELMDGRSPNRTRHIGNHTWEEHPNGSWCRRSIEICVTAQSDRQRELLESQSRLDKARERATQAQIRADEAKRNQTTLQDEVNAWEADLVAARANVAEQEARVMAIQQGAESGNLTAAQQELQRLRNEVDEVASVLNDTRGQHTQATAASEETTMGLSSAEARAGKAQTAHQRHSDLAREIDELEDRLERQLLHNYGNVAQPPNSEWGLGMKELDRMRGQLSEQMYTSRGVTTAVSDVLRDLSPPRPGSQARNEILNDLQSDFGVNGRLTDAGTGDLIDGSIYIDHVVPFDRIVQMDGFNQLSSRTQQLEVLNLRQNFMPQNMRMSSSKSNRTMRDWFDNTPLGRTIPPDRHDDLLRREATALSAIREAIEERLRR